MCLGPAEAEPAGQTDTQTCSHAEQTDVGSGGSTQSPGWTQELRRLAQGTAHPSFACLFYLGPQRISASRDTLPDTPRGKVPQPSGRPRPAGTHRVNHHTELLSPEASAAPGHSCCVDVSPGAQGCGRLPGVWARGLTARCRAPSEKAPGRRRTFVLRGKTRHRQM